MTRAVEKWTDDEPGNTCKPNEHVPMLCPLSLIVLVGEGSKNHKKPSQFVLSIHDCIMRHFQPYKSMLHINSA
jgi:hypothetical protein